VSRTERESLVFKKIHEENRLSWNEATIAQNSHRGDQIAFFRNGGITLYPEERELLGDIKGLSLVHLQCNSGQDTLSLAQLGAVVVGVDISDTAIEIARTLSTETGLSVVFHRMDIYDWLEKSANEGQLFDKVFCSYGTVCWLSDLYSWAKGIAAILKPNGQFILVDYHPMALAFDEELNLAFPYFAEANQERIVTWENGVSDFVAQTQIGLPGLEFVEGIKEFKNPYSVHEFHWGIGQIVTALLEAKLVLMTLKEYPYSNGYKPFNEMILSGQRWYPPDNQPTIPLMYGITAYKPEEK